MHREATVIAAVAASLGSADVGAASFSAILQGFSLHSSSGSTAGNASSSTATWSYDASTGRLSQTGGTLDVRFTISPTTTLFRYSITGLALSNGGAASAASYICTEGNFGPSVGASVCGNYGFGANFANESTVTWGPGTAAARNLGGDDVAFGSQQSIRQFDNTRFVSWVGTALVLSNVRCDPSAPGGANNCSTSGGINTGYTWTFFAGPCYVDTGEILEPCSLPPPLVPVPAAAWLFGGALLALGSVRRRFGPSSPGAPRVHRR